MGTRPKLTTGLTLAAMFTAVSAIAAPIGLTSAVATYDQGNPYTIATTIDNNLGSSNGWGVYNGQTSAQTAVFTAGAPVNSDELKFQLLFLNQHSNHMVKQFRLSATTDATPSLGGSWTELAPVSMWAHNPSALTDAGSNQVHSTGGSGSNRQTYTVNTTSGGLSNITGFRLETFPIGGTLGYASNGNFVVTEVRVNDTATFATGGSNDSSLAFTHSSTDLLNGIVGTSSIPVTGGAYSSGMPELTNGLGTGTPGSPNDRRTLANSNTANWVQTYDLGLTSSVWAEIAAIRVFSHNTDGRVFQDYDVEISPDGTNWSMLRAGITNGTKTFDLNSGAGTSGDYVHDFFATEVRSLGGGWLTNPGDYTRYLRFTFRPVTGPSDYRFFIPGGTISGHTSLYEIDVLGTVVPEPSTFLIWTLGLLGLIGWRRRRTK